MTRKKLPAYGAALRDKRRRGELPLCVHLIYGFKWRANPKCWWAGVIRGEHPELALKPEDYAPGVFDFSFLVGLQVSVFDQVGEAGFFRDPDFGPMRPIDTRFWHLLGELGQHAADVEVYSPAFEEQWRAVELANWQRRDRRWAGIAVNAGWPFWWSAEIEEVNAKRRQTWCRIVFDPAERQCA